MVMFLLVHIVFAAVVIAAAATSTASSTPITDTFINKQVGSPMLKRIINVDNC